jgi:hypothetical protein
MATRGREIDEDDQRRIRKLARDFPASAGRGRMGGISHAARIVGVDRHTARKYAREQEIRIIKKKFG